jgi:hypothetical protein
MRKSAWMTFTKLPSRSQYSTRLLLRLQMKSSGFSPRVSRAMPWQVLKNPADGPGAPKGLHEFAILVELEDVV